jgi:hypothetical protein
MMLRILFAMGKLEIRVSSLDRIFQCETDLSGGNDDCPVPQYATCSEPTSMGGLRAVPQKSSVESC